jgi:hypothetical protein
MLKKYFLPVLLLISLNSFAQKINILNRFEGKWIMQKGDKIIGEDWTKISEAWFQNKGYFIKGADTIVTERVALKRVNGEIFYTSTVEDQNNKQPVAFKLTFYKKGKFIFENPQHDFPKRIVYDFTSPETLHAYIDDGTDGSKKQHFYYKKVK